MSNSESGKCITSDQERRSSMSYEKAPFILKTYCFVLSFIHSCSLESCSVSSVGSYILSTPSVSKDVIV